MNSDYTDEMLLKFQEERNVASLIPAKVKSSERKTRFVRKSSSVYHQHKEWNPSKHAFKAHPVPKATYNWPDQAVQRKHHPEVKPFSFYERDQEIERRKNDRRQKIHEEEEKLRTYIARPVPNWLNRYTTPLTTPEKQRISNYVERVLPTLKRAEAHSNSMDETIGKTNLVMDEEMSEQCKKEDKRNAIESVAISQRSIKEYKSTVETVARKHKSEPMSQRAPCMRAPILVKNQLPSQKHKGNVKKTDERKAVNKVQDFEMKKKSNKVKSLIQSRKVEDHWSARFKEHAAKLEKLKREVASTLESHFEC